MYVVFYICHVPLTASSCLADRFQVAQIPEYKPVVAETKTSTCREQRNSLFGGKPFYSSSIRRWELQTPEGSATRPLYLSETS